LSQDCARAEMEVAPPACAPPRGPGCRSGLEESFGAPYTLDFAVARDPALGARPEVEGVLEQVLRRESRRTRSSRSPLRALDLAEVEALGRLAPDDSLAGWAIGQLVLSEHSVITAGATLVETTYRVRHDCGAWGWVSDSTQVVYDAVGQPAAGRRGCSDRLRQPCYNSSRVPPLPSCTGGQQ
jgi:hypothetical protein